MNWKTDLFRPECNVNIDINAINHVRGHRPEVRCPLT